MRAIKKEQATTNQIDLLKQPPDTKARSTIIAEGTTIFRDEFNEELECIYFGDSCHEHNYSETDNYWRRSGIFIGSFEHISHLALVFLLLALNM